MILLLLIYVIVVYELILVEKEKEYEKILNKYENLKEKTILNIEIDKINIKKSFKNAPPSENKMKEREEYFIKNGEFKTIIKIDAYGILRDGYTSYLLAKKYNIKKVEFIRV